MDLAKARPQYLKDSAKLLMDDQDRDRSNSQKTSLVLADSVFEGQPHPRQVLSVLERHRREEIFSFTGESI